MVDFIIESSLFVLSFEVEDRDEVQGGNWGEAQKDLPSTLNDILVYYFIFKWIQDHKKKSDMNLFILFCCSYNFQTNNLF
jgi:hypothetical protein